MLHEYDFSFNALGNDTESMPGISQELSRSINSNHVYTNDVVWLQVLSDFTRFLSSAYGYDLSKSIAVVDDADAGEYTTLYALNL